MRQMSLRENARQRLCTTQTQSIHSQQSWQCKAAVEVIRSSRILGDQVLKWLSANALRSGGRARLTVEACMRAWQSVFVPVITVDIKSAEAIHSLKLSKAVERHFAGSSDELQEFGTLFLVERPDRAPEPLDLRRGGGVIMVFGMALPIVDIDIRKTGDEELQLLLVEDCDQLGGNNVMEAWA